MAKKYFDTDMPVSDEMADIFDTADRNPHDFLRIVYKHGNMMYSCREFEFRVSKAILIFSDSSGVHRILFDRHTNSHYSFQCAVFPNQFLVFTLEVGGFCVEKRLFFQDDSCCLIIMKTYNSTIFITYDGSREFVGRDYVQESDGYASVTDLLEMAIFPPKPNALNISIVDGEKKDESNA